MRRPGAWELAALALGLAVWSYLGWDSALWDAGSQLALHLAAVAALAAVVFLAVRGVALPRTRLELPILVLLLAFAVASLSAWNAGLSARAMAAIVGSAAMLPVAMLALRHRPGWTALVVTVPIIVLSAGTLAVLAWRRVEWLLVGAPGLPPVRMAHEGTPFGSVAVPPFVILAALPLVLAIPWRGPRRVILGLLLGLGIPLTVVSGSRSAWVAIAVASAVLAGPWVVRRLRSARWRRPGAREAIGAVLVVGLAALVVVYSASRLDDVSSLVYREYLWRDTLLAWRADPLLGIGPGSMPWARQAVAPELSFPVQQPHSHNVLLGILGDAGLVGLVAALAVVLAFVLVAGPWRQRSGTGRAAFAVLAGLGAGMMFEDLTFLPNFNLEVVLLVGLALGGADAVRWRPMRHAATRSSVRGRARRRLGAIAAGAGAAALFTVFLVGDAARVAYDAGMHAAEQGQWPSATTWLQRSAALDPWQPSTPKALSVAAERADRPGLALASARRAVALNAGDGLSWTNVAVLCRERGDRSCARQAAQRAEATATPAGPQLANAAVTFAWLGDTAAADHAYRLSLLTNWWTAVTLPWPRALAVSTDVQTELDATVLELNVVIARGFQAEAQDPADYAALPARMLAAAATGDRELALSLADRLQDAAGSSVSAWDLIALVRHHFGLPIQHVLDVAAVADGRSHARGPGTGGPALPPRSIRDIASFRSYPADGLVRGATRLLADRPWPWALEPMLPAG